MRASGCGLQQSLTPSAASVVKQSLLLARRRGHCQVTPLHVANTMLAVADPTGSFRSACLKSHSHPLQCKALELCFNVALNRLPTSSYNNNPNPNTNPSISNALVAAFKRAQAHQRRGSVEAQHLLSPAKIDLDQLVVSILDDPSVSRVMREAGFSSTQVKANLQFQTTTSTSPDNNKEDQENNNTSTIMIKSDEDDVSIVIEALLLGRNRNKRKSLVLVGECVSALESVVKGLMDRVDKGRVPESLKEIKLVTIPPLYTFCNLRREEVEEKVEELTRLVKSVLGRGVVLYLGDFKWISEFKGEEKEERRYYCSVEHVIMEIGRLVWGIGESERFWLMGVATFPTYIKCRNSSLERVWGLHPVTIPADTLSFGLGSQRLVEANSLSCCGDCSAKFEEEARNLRCNGPALSSELPCWLKDESRRLNNQNHEDSEAMKKLCMKWNSFCSSAHKVEKTMTTSTDYISFDRQNQQRWTRNLLRMAPEIVGINAISSTSTSSSSETNCAHKLKEFSAENLNILCNALDKKFPCHKDIIPEIAGTILQSRSGMFRRKDQKGGYNNNNNNKQETWMLFLGPDPARTKEKISKELAKVVFGSYSCFLSIGLSRNKRGRDEDNCKTYLERFCRAVSEDPRRVFFLEDLEHVDYCSRVGIKRAIEGGKIRNVDGDEFCFLDAVVVLSCESLESKSGCVSLDLNISLDGVDDRVVDEFGVFENVDRRVVFKIQDL